MSDDRRVNLNISLIETLLAIEKETLKAMGIKSIEEINKGEGQLPKMRGFFAPKAPAEALETAHKVAEKEAGIACKDRSCVEASGPILHEEQKESCDDGR